MFYPQKDQTSSNHINQNDINLYINLPKYYIGKNGNHFSPR